jgi:hypothetical protein
MAGFETRVLAMSTLGGDVFIEIRRTNVPSSRTALRRRGRRLVLIKDDSEYCRITECRLMANVGSDDDGEEELSTVDQQRSVSCSPCFRMTKTER